MKTLGNDVSIWQDDNSTAQTVDFSVMRNQGSRFVFIKTSQATYLDQDFITNWNNAKGKLYRGGYHFLDWTKSTIDQARFFAGALRQDSGELPAVVDYECRTNVPPKSTAISYLKNFISTFQIEFPNKRLMIYTSPGFWSEFGSNESYWKQFDLWIAHYYVDSPKIPLPWTSYKFHQFSDKYDGKFYGAESTYIDANWFNGSELDLDSYAENIPQMELSDKEKIDILWNDYLERTNG